MTGPGAKTTMRWPVTLTRMAMFQMKVGGGDGEMADFAGALHCLCISVASGYNAISLSRFLRLGCTGCGLFGMRFFFFTESFIFHSWGWRETWDCGDSQGCTLRWPWAFQRLHVMENFKIVIYYGFQRLAHPLTSLVTTRKSEWCSRFKTVTHSLGCAFLWVLTLFAL